MAIATSPASRFGACLPYTLDQECAHWRENWNDPRNFSDDAHDSGGATMCGITHEDYDEDRIKRGLPTQDVIEMSRQEGTDIYFHKYWLPYAPLMGVGLDMVFFDTEVNQGVSGAIKVLQRVLGVTDDGEWGDETAKALAAADLFDTITAFTAGRKDAYREMKEFPVFRNGWLRRADEIGAAGAKMFDVAYPADADVAPTANAEGWPLWATLGQADVGFHEVGNNLGIGQFIEQAHAGAEGDPWCAIWANAKLEEAGIRGTRSASSQSFRHSPDFVKLDGAAPGAIAVYWRGNPSSGIGHVGFYLGETDTQVLTLGGNESDAVRQQFEPMSRLYGYWWPKSQPTPTGRVVRVSNRDGHPVGSEI